MRTIHTVTRIETVINRATGKRSEPVHFPLSSHDPGSWPSIEIGRHEAAMRERVGSGVSEHGHGTPTLPRTFLEELAPGRPGNWVREIRFAILTRDENDGADRAHEWQRGDLVNYRTARGSTILGKVTAIRDDIEVGDRWLQFRVTGASSPGYPRGYVHLARAASVEFRRRGAGAK